MTHQRSNRAGYVYFVQEAELRRIKIGFTTGHPVQRLKTLANASSQELVFLGFQIGDEALEKKLHAKFEALHCRNEWFHAGPDLLTHIEQLSYGSEFEQALRQFVLAPGQRRPQSITGAVEPNPVAELAIPVDGTVPVPVGSPAL
ncbi:GIY-YIG nuclease family protein [Aquitalea denitrificans]|uniref:GIY-YIG nuclease family protein n=1 Tax=Aquitalea denitrificans TaxID=519081 RepID=UPI0013597B51|nr:GIY-YIG nuclease family protein [Aquitalea denitrificans]